MEGGEEDHENLPPSVPRLKALNQLLLMKEQEKQVAIKGPGIELVS